MICLPGTRSADKLGGNRLTPATDAQIRGMRFALFVSRRLGRSDDVGGNEETEAASLPACHRDPQEGASAGRSRRTTLTRRSRVRSGYGITDPPRQRQLVALSRRRRIRPRMSGYGEHCGPPWPRFAARLPTLLTRSGHEARSRPACGLRQFRLTLASDLATARTQSMKAVTTGDKVRCFSVRMITGQGSGGRSTDNALSPKRCA